MGQYYKPVILNEFDEIVATIISWDYECGAKLMEHSWMLNPFVHRFEHLISPNGKFHKSRVVWAGDYADVEPGQMVFSDYYKKEVEANLHYLSDKIKPLKGLKEVDGTQYRYVVNHTKKEFVDKTKVIDFDGWRIHPLPLLTCEGNGRGGGDYHINTYKRRVTSKKTILPPKTIDCNKPGEAKQIGRWSRDVISVEYDKPTDDYKEIKFTLYEEW